MNNNFEQIKQMGDSPENMRLVANNLMQFILAENHGETMEDFEKLHSKTFGDLMAGRPDLFEKFTTDPETTLKEVESIIYN